MDAAPASLGAFIDLEERDDLAVGGVVVHVKLPVVGQLIQRRAWAIPIAAFRLVEMRRAFRDLAERVTEYGYLFTRFDAGEPEFRSGYAATGVA